MRRIPAAGRISGCRTGTEDHYIQDSVSYYCCTDDGIKNQRAYLRKPQFTYGWDWCPSVPTCGIGGRLELRGRTGAEITGFRADTVSISEKEAVLALHFEIDKTDMACAAERTEGKTAITLCAESFIPCVYLTGRDPEQKFEDNYFPMLPGEVRTVYAEGSCNGIEVKAVPVSRSPASQ